MRYIVEIQDGVLKKWATDHRQRGLGWTYHRYFAREFTTRKQAEQAIAELHGGTVVEVDA